ncbi:MAG: hypothetical protein LBT89_03670, partial [Planctomycetaceae bacterium]|nr:hypothetical protein [Planctomycetaceae bacterium]
GSLDTFSLFLEWAFRNVKKNGYVHFIVPLSIVSSDSMTALHQLLFNNCETIKVSNYAKRPVMMFPHSEIRVSIISFVKTHTKCEHLWTTKLNRRSKEVSREKLLQGLQFTDGLRFRLNGRIPKISRPIENKILRKLFAKKHTRIKSLLREEGKPVYYRTSGGLYYNVITNYSTDSTKEKPLCFDKNIADVVGAILSSSLFWWYQQVYTNNLDLKSYEIESFPIPVAKLTPAVRAKIEKLYKQYLRSIERNVIEHETQEYKHVTKYKEYKIRYSKPLIDQIDGLICPLYALTHEETEFIKNYEIEFRINSEEKPE